MELGRNAPTGSVLANLMLGSALMALTGCATMNPDVDRALMVDDGGAARFEAVSQVYRIGSPDLLDVTIVGAPDASGSKIVGPDGRIELGRFGEVRIEGLTAGEAASQIAAAAHLPESNVRVSVAEYRSQIIYVLGQVVGAQHAVAYMGPEKVLDVLRRAGGITAGAAPDAVYLVRSRVTEGQSPEVVRVDVRAILFREEEKTNITVQPLDQIFVGESRRCTFDRALAPWLRPLFELCCGMHRGN
jgi:polysaccharide biosynthesis/export protein